MPDRHGPFRVARFLLEIDGVAKAGFSHCRLPASSTAVVEYREGNDRYPTPRKLAGLNEYGPLVLRNGVTTSSIELHEWRRQVERGMLDEARGTAAVVLLDEEGVAAARWEFRNVWPTRYEGPTLDANRSAVAIETLELACEGYERAGVGSDDETDDPPRKADLEDVDPPETPRLSEAVSSEKPGRSGEDRSETE